MTPLAALFLYRRIRWLKKLAGSTVKPATAPAEAGEAVEPDSSPGSSPAARSVPADRDPTDGITRRP